MAYYSAQCVNFFLNEQLITKVTIFIGFLCYIRHWRKWRPVTKSLSIFTFYLLTYLLRYRHDNPVCTDLIRRRAKPIFSSHFLQFHSLLTVDLAWS